MSEFSILYLETGHPLRFCRQMGMNQLVFHKLLRDLEEKAGLRSTQHVSSEEQLAIFLCIARTGLSNTEMQERFQRSGETISKYVQYNFGFRYTILMVIQMFSPYPQHACFQRILQYLCPPTSQCGTI